VIELPTQRVATNIECSPGFSCHVLQQILLWWCRPTGTVNCIWYIIVCCYHRMWNDSL
jgi:hypothetical protein